MRLVRYLSAVSLAAALACGGDGGSPAPPPTEPADPDGGEEPGGGTNPGDGGSPGGGGGDPSVTIVSSSSDPECAGLLPSRVPPAVSIHVGQDTGCLGGVSEGNGHVAVGVLFVQGGTGAGATVWQVFSPSGDREGSFTFPWRTDPRPWLFPQADGWQGVTASGSSGVGPDELLVRTMTSDGTLRREERVSAPGTRSWRPSQDPLGGTLVVATGNRDGACFGEAFRFDASGAVRGAAGRAGCLVAAGAVSMRGESLVVELDGGSVTDREIIHWIRPDGTDASSPSLDPAPGAIEYLEPLLDGSVVGRRGAAWVRRYPHLAAASEPAPDWLASRPGWLFRFTRGNRGYALFPPQGEPLASCMQTIEIRAPSGRLCGTIAFGEEGGACAASWMDQGWDGTVVAARDACRYRWWPRLLAGD